MADILLLDNIDSFTYNLADQLRTNGHNVVIYRNHIPAQTLIDRLATMKNPVLMLSPGPGAPSEAGCMPELLTRLRGKLPIIGICLGHQAIGEAFGARLENLKEVYHGVQTPISILQKDVLFEGLGKEIPVGRYHSWVVSREGFPECLEITAESQEGQIMAIRHKTYNVHGIQFHPESVLTPQGKEIIKNFLND